MSSKLMPVLLFLSVARLAVAAAACSNGPAHSPFELGVEASPTHVQADPPPSNTRRL